MPQLCALPTAIATGESPTGHPGVTATGVEELLAVPLPSCPLVPSPQHQTPPPAMTQVWSA